MRPAVLALDGADHVDKKGMLTICYRGWLHHIDIGASYRDWRVAMLVKDRDMVARSFSEVL